MCSSMTPFVWDKKVVSHFYFLTCAENFQSNSEETINKWDWGPVVGRMSLLTTCPSVLFEFLPWVYITFIVIEK